MVQGTDEFLWVTEFPLFTPNDPDKEFLAHGRKWTSTHHPFTAPMIEDIPALQQGDFEKVCTSTVTTGRGFHDYMPQVRGQHYDLVLNGMEIAGGSVRIHDATLQDYIFKEVLEVRYTSAPFTVPCLTLFQLTPQERSGFAELLRALRCGAPPHGGIALGKPP